MKYRSLDMNTKAHKEVVVERYISLLKSKIERKDKTIDTLSKALVDMHKKQSELEQKLWEKENEERMEDYMDEKIQRGDFWYKRVYWHRGYMTPKEKRAKERKEKGITELPVPYYKHPDMGWIEYS
mgnify:CR=1 FL=1|tara:strand:+ start:1946 stop:2323 length:378 start_codon:yes stop_codon:yes gene_type:complete